MSRVTGPGRRGRCRVQPPHFGAFREDRDLVRRFPGTIALVRCLATRFETTAETSLAAVTPVGDRVWLRDGGPRP